MSNIFIEKAYNKIMDGKLVFTDYEIKAISQLYFQLKTAELYNYNKTKMCFIDGFLSCLNCISNKKFGFNGTRIYVHDYDKSEHSNSVIFLTE